MERLGPIARKVLQDAKRAMEARKDGLERREGSNEFEPEPSREGKAQDSGIRERITERGLETCGRVGAFRAPDSCNDALSRHQRGNTYRYEFTNAGYSVRVRFTGDARWFDLRAVPRRAWLGGGESPLPRPSSRLLIAQNDNRHGMPRERSAASIRAATLITAGS